jgi:hypothetical protein
MLGFHRRTRSLIPVKDLAKYDKLQMQDEDEMDIEMEVQEGEFDVTSKAAIKSRHRQVFLIYVIFLAEA